MVAAGLVAIGVISIILSLVNLALKINDMVKFPLTIGQNNDQIIYRHLETIRYGMNYYSEFFDGLNALIQSNEKAGPVFAACRSDLNSIKTHMLSMESTLSTGNSDVDNVQEAFDSLALIDLIATGPLRTCIERKYEEIKGDRKIFESLYAPVDKFSILLNFRFPHIFYGQTPIALYCEREQLLCGLYNWEVNANFKLQYPEAETRFMIEYVGGCGGGICVQPGDTVAIRSVANGRYWAHDKVHGTQSRMSVVREKHDLWEHFDILNPTQSQIQKKFRSGDRIKVKDYRFGQYLASYWPSCQGRPVLTAVNDPTDAFVLLESDGSIAFDSLEIFGAFNFNFNSLIAKLNSGNVKVAILSKGNQKFLKAYPDGNVASHAKWVQPWETFEVIKAEGENRFRFKNYHGKYLTAHDNIIVNSRDEPYEFVIEKSPVSALHVALKGRNGRFIRTKPCGGVYAETEQISHGESYLLVFPY